MGCFRRTLDALPRLLTLPPPAHTRNWNIKLGRQKYRWTVRECVLLNGSSEGAQSYEKYKSYLSWRLLHRGWFGNLEDVCKGKWQPAEAWFLANSVLFQPSSGWSGRARMSTCSRQPQSLSRKNVVSWPFRGSAEAGNCARMLDIPSGIVIPLACVLFVSYVFLSTREPYLKFVTRPGMNVYSCWPVTPPRWEMKNRASNRAL